MSSSLAPLSESAIVTKLRSVGCVFAEDEARLLVDAARTPAELTAMVDRRVAGQPLEHILGWVEFCGMRIAVDPDVFVPRQRTELLVRHAISLVTSADRTPSHPHTVILDLCCGSGALGVALAAALGRIRSARIESGSVDIGPLELYAADIEPAAVRCAHRNVAVMTSGGTEFSSIVRTGEVFEGDLYEPLPSGLRGRVSVLLANAPYVPSEAIGMMPPEARDYEPRGALDGGVDGLDILRRVIAEAPHWLAPGGSVLVETSKRQAPAVVALVAGTALSANVVNSADLGATVVVATLAASIPGRPGDTRP
jgi:release factor glutamine methyltransferase